MPEPASLLELASLQDGLCDFANLFGRDSSNHASCRRAANGLTQDFQIEPFLANAEIIIEKRDRNRGHRRYQQRNNVLQDGNGDRPLTKAKSEGCHDSDSNLNEHLNHDKDQQDEKDFAAIPLHQFPAPLTDLCGHCSILRS